MPFEQRPVPRDRREEIAQAARRAGGTRNCVTDEGGKRQVGPLAAQAVDVHPADPAFRGELSDWIKKRINEAYDRYATEFERLTPEQPMAGRTPPPVDESALSIPSAAGAARTFATADRVA